MTRPAESWSISIAKDYLKFSAAHFLIFPDGTAERLHGHNYKVFVDVHTELNEHGLVVNFQEIKPLAQNLSQLGDTGLEAISYLKLGMPPPREWRDASLAKIDEASKPHGALEFVVISGVKQLVNMAAEIKP